MKRNVQMSRVYFFIGFRTYNFREHAEHDKLGFIITNGRMETSVFGIYAVGDIMVQPVRHVTKTVGDGTVAAVIAEKYLEKHSLFKRDQ